MSFSSLGGLVPIPFWCFVFLSFFGLGQISYSSESESPGLESSDFFHKIEPLPFNVRERMMSSTWKPECPVGLDDLSYLTLTHWGFDHRIHTGHLVVHRDVAQPIADIFRDIFSHKFPIERMGLASDFRGNDEELMSQNVTSAFNCRTITGRTDAFSNHSYGIALDINPVQNPYVKGSIVLPVEGKAYLSRDSSHPGIITKNSFVQKAFLKKGWTWGGDWQSLKDYQHFENVMAKPQ